MKDTREVRKANIAINASDLSQVTNKTIEINIKGILPLVSIANDTIVGAVYVEEVCEVVDLTTITNTLTDIEYNAEFLADGTTENPTAGKDRFEYITTSVSSLTNSIIRIYKDNKYDDIIIIPNTVFLGSNAVDDMITKENFEVYGYVVGGGEGNRGQTLESNTLQYDEKFMIKIGKVKTNISNTNRQYSLPGISDTTKDRRYLERMVTDNLNYSNAKSIPLGSIDLGKPLELLEEKQLLPTYIIYKEDMNKFVMKFLGNKMPEAGNNLHILLNF